VLPGHGLPGGRELMAGQAQFMSELYKSVKAGIDQGKKVEDLQASIQMPATVSEWVSEASLKRQIKDAFDEISQGKPRGDIQ
jgi:cyclase